MGLGKAVRAAAADRVPVVVELALFVDAQVARAAGSVYSVHGCNLSRQGLRLEALGRVQHPGASFIAQCSVDAALVNVSCSAYAAFMPKRLPDDDETAVISTFRVSHGVLAKFDAWVAKLNRGRRGPRLSRVDVLRGLMDWAADENPDWEKR